MYKKIKIEFVEASNVRFLEDGSTELRASCRSYDPEYHDGFEDSDRPAAHYDRVLVPVVLASGVAVSQENIEAAILAKEGYTQSY